MAFTTPTLTGAVGVNDQSIYLSALTNVAVGNLIGIDKEIVKVLAVPALATAPVPVLRGVEGTYNAPHASGAQAKVGATPTNLTQGDWTQAAPGAPSLSPMPGAFSREIASYSANGAITLPRIGGDMVAMLNGVVALAMTLANPSSGQDGSRLTILSNGKAAHTVTYAAGFGGNGAGGTVLTLRATQAQAVELIACGGFWVLEGVVAGAATVAGAGLA
jgi:hypothetical protein